METDDGEEQVYDEQRAAELRSLIDSDPPRALAIARQPKPDGFHPVNWDLLRAGVLIDAGEVLHDVGALAEGETILRQLMEVLPEKPDIRYNLANAIEGQTRLHAADRPLWYAETSARRAECRRLHRSAAGGPTDIGQGGDQRSQALTNLGNLLSSASRWAEAYDQYVAALGADPTNGVAAGSAAQMLQYLLQRGLGAPDILDRVARYYASRAVDNATRVAALAGPRAVAAFKALPRLEEPWRPVPIREIANPYLRFVAEHRLALVPTIEGFDATQRRWDIVSIASVRLAPGAGPQVPAIFAMFNLLKADFATARWLAHEASAAPHPDDGLYVDTLDYGVYGRRTSSLVLAQRAALDLLDRVAVCVNEYLGIGLNPKNVTYRRFWWVGKNGKREWRPEIASEIQAGNLAALALADLSEDLEPHGALRSHIDARNAGTHRFLVLHDIGIGDSAECPSEGVPFFL